MLLGLFMKTEIMVAKKCLLLRNTLFNIPSNKCAIDAKGMVFFRVLKTKMSRFGKIKLNLANKSVARHLMSFIAVNYILNLARVSYTILHTVSLLQN